MRQTATGRLAMDNSEWLLGHQPLESKLNVRAELKRLRQDPIEPLIQALGKEPGYLILQDEFSRYLEAYYFYYLSLDRFFHEMSVAVRWGKGPHLVRKYGGKYTPSQRKLAAQYNKIARFLEFDFFNCLLYARMLLDRTIALSRHFLKGANLPSFTSFNDHKKFFQRQKTPYGGFEEYAAYIREQTDWFDTPLKAVRDKFLVHTGPQHLRVFGYPSNGYEIRLMIMVPNGNDPEKSLARVKVIEVSIPQLARDIEQFLTWFCAYGLLVLGNRQRNATQGTISIE
jgi:hypothetical protein